LDELIGNLPGSSIPVRRGFKKAPFCNRIYA
jgi:hypothetical protein